MAIQDFETEVVGDQRGRVYIELPFDPAEVWGRRSRHYVRGDINSTSFEGSLGARGGRNDKERGRQVGVIPSDGRPDKRPGTAYPASGAGKLWSSRGHMH